MITVKQNPKNKNHFIKLKKFAQRIFDICKELEIKPVLWGGLAYFAYTKERDYIIKDMDLLVPARSIKKIINILKKRKIKHMYLEDWHSLIISQGNLKVELDPIEWYYSGRKRFQKCDFDGFIVDMVNLNSLIKMYERASKVSQDKPEQHKKRLNTLIKIKKTVNSQTRI